MTPAEIAARCANDYAFFAEVTLKIAEAMQGQQWVGLDGLSDDDVQIIRQHAAELNVACSFRFLLGRPEL